MIGLLRALGAAAAKRINRRPPGADLSVPATRDEIEAEWRWHRANEVGRARGCKCGRPATVPKVYPGTVGTIPHISWRCEEHREAESWGRHDDGAWIPYYHHSSPCPVGETSGTMGSIDAPPTIFMCPHRTHDDTEAARRG